ncbi:spore coat protein A [Planotetraspora thailandica]|uniref:Spore coat protein A n=1 Tax=Planotetraspora thailandica TaxID=487172 RepID=A0A8J3V384_9ACTN|nr:multicopper oxidase domain-containing protein [Planotetraspora thailandica]GII56904.1 spore coat protein A [Planotetraspora thailandica]
MRLTRREFARVAAVTGIGVAWGARRRGGMRKFTDPLPIPPVAVPDTSSHPGIDYYELTMRQSTWRFHRDLGVAQAWGYWAADPGDPARPLGLGCLGPTLVARRNRPVIVRYRNGLPTSHLFSDRIDSTLWRNLPDVPADPPGGRHMDMPADVTVWNVVHLHGGWNPTQSDGNPAAWFTPRGAHGPMYGSLPGAAPDEAIYAYGNAQRAAMLWYHDHAMELTRLNNYAGLSGLYIIRDVVEDALGLPRGRFEVPLIIQDRTFERDGSLFYPGKGVTPYHPIWMPEFFGEVPVVNGKAYPFLAVEPRRYRLRVLNASNARFYHLWLARDETRLPFWLIGSSGALRDFPLRVDRMLLAPSERADIIVDFGRLPMGAAVTLMNDAAVPYPGGGGGQPIPEIMRFHVSDPLTGRDKSTPPEKLALPPLKPIQPGPAAPRREFVLTERLDRRGQPVHMTINERYFFEPVDDFVTSGTTEIWEYVNTTEDAHPMHVHLVQFLIHNRQRFNARDYAKDFARWTRSGRLSGDKPDLSRYLVGAPIPPEPDQQGWRDTFIAYPGMVNRIVATFDPAPEVPQVGGTSTVFPAGYIHHCHILEHEDNDMMRPWHLVR